jgi:hypothetical protein
MRQGYHRVAYLLARILKLLIVPVKNDLRLKPSNKPAIILDRSKVSEYR